MHVYLQESEALLIGSSLLKKLYTFFATLLCQGRLTPCFPAQDEQLPPVHPQVSHSIMHFRASSLLACNVHHALEDISQTHTTIVDHSPEPIPTLPAFAEDLGPHLWRILGALECQARCPPHKIFPPRYSVTMPGSLQAEGLSTPGHSGGRWITI